MKSPIIDRKEDCWVSILADILWSIHSETINIQYHTHIYTYVNSDITVGYICFNLLNWGFRLSLRSPPFWFHFRYTYVYTSLSECVAAACALLIVPYWQSLLLQSPVSACPLHNFGIVLPESNFVIRRKVPRSSEKFAELIYLSCWQIYYLDMYNVSMENRIVAMNILELW